jgi:phospholipase/carboxylesterase
MDKIYTIERPAEQQDGPPPLLLLLHGYGSNEHDLMGLAPYVSPRFHIVSARALYDIGMGFAWYHLYGVPGHLIDDNASRDHSLEVLTKFVASLPERVGSDPQRVYLFGFSQGAVMSMALALTAPHLVAGVVGVSGYIKEATMQRVQPDALSHLDMLVQHGTHDDLLPVDLGRQAQAYLETLPLRLTYTEYPIGHGIHPQGVLQIQRWLDERLNQSRATS